MRSLMRVSSVEIAASPLGASRRRETTADVQEASTVAPDAPSDGGRIDCNGPVSGGSTHVLWRTAGRWGRTALCGQSHFPSIVFQRGYQREQFVDALRRAPARRPSGP